MSEQVVPTPERGEVVAYNRAGWSFDQLTDEQFLDVAAEAVRIFVEDVVIKSEPGMAEHIRRRYLEGDLKVDRKFAIPESGSNDISLDFFRRRIIFRPHVGRGSGTDDSYLKSAIDRFNRYLEEHQISHKVEMSFSDVRDL